MPAEQRLPDATVLAARAALSAGAARAAAEWGLLLGPEAGPVAVEPASAGAAAGANASTRAGTPAASPAGTIPTGPGPGSLPSLRPSQGQPAGPGERLELGFEFQGGANGSARLNLDAADARALANRLPGRNGDEGPLDASERAAVLELGSVLLGEAVAALLAGVREPVRWSLPRLQSPTPGASASPGARDGSGPGPDTELETRLTVIVGSERIAAGITLGATADEWRKWHEALAALGPDPERRAA